MTEPTGDAPLYQLYLAYNDAERKALEAIPGTPPGMGAVFEDLCRPETEAEFLGHLARLSDDARSAYVAELLRGYGSQGNHVGRDSGDVQSESLERGEVPPDWRDRLGPGLGLEQLSEWVRSRAARPRGRAS